MTCGSEWIVVDPPDLAKRLIRPDDDEHAADDPTIDEPPRDIDAHKTHHDPPATGSPSPPPPTSAIPRP